MCKIIAIANQKGGVAKTTTTINLGVGLSKVGKRVMLIDADPQGHLTMGLGFPKNLRVTLKTMMENIIMGLEFDPREAILHHEEGIDVIPSNKLLSGMDMSLFTVEDREKVLKEYLELLENDYDYILIDCMPSLGMMTINALSAADSVLIPVQPQYYAADGLMELLKVVKGIHQRFNPDLQIEGILFTMDSSHYNNSKRNKQAVRDAYGAEIIIFDQTIPRTEYADDFIIGVIGSKADAEQMKADVGRFLREELDLEMSETKTKVTHTGDRARFLGYDITVSRSQDLKKSAGGYKIRSNAGVVKVLVPREKWVGKLLEYHAIKIKINENGKERFVALHRGKLVNQSDIEILARYNAEVRGLYNYYAIANDSFKIGRFANLMKYSMYKTFACKYKTNVHEIKRRYCVGGLFTIAYDTRAGRKITTFYRDGFKRKESATKFDNVSELPQFSKYAKTNTLKQRVERHTCELCGKDCRNLEIHQVKKLKDLKGNAEWVLLMRKRRRKTLVVCPECHKLIHS